MFSVTVKCCYQTLKFVVIRGVGLQTRILVSKFRPSVLPLEFSSSAPPAPFLSINADFPFQLQFSLEPEPIAINCTAFNHNGNLLVTGAADGIVRLFGTVERDLGVLVDSLL